jgi:hypothetical protein
MNLSLFACGPGGGLIIIAYLIYGGAALSISTFVLGGISLCTGGKTLGLGLIGFSGCVGVLLLKWLGFI